LLTAALISTIKRESTVAFQWQQWLRERASMLRYMYIACFAQIQCTNLRFNTRCHEIITYKGMKVGKDYIQE